MSVTEMSITNPKKQLEFYKQLSEQLQQENKQLKENYERIYNENCILREKNNINDIGLLDENYKLKQVVDKAIEYIENNTYSSVATMKTTLHLQNDELYDLLEILKVEE